MTCGLMGVMQAAAYYRSFTARLPVSTLTFATADSVPLGGGGLERGTFKVVYPTPDGIAPLALDGQYVRLWHPSRTEG